MKGKISKHLRPMFEFIKENYDTTKPLVGVELGVKGGRNAWYILTGLPIKMLYLVDCYDEKHIHAKSDMENDVLKVFIHNTKFIYKKSVDAVDDIPNNLDFVYVDTDHMYENTKNEIELYYKKLKKGGVLGGHDYLFMDTDVQCYNTKINKLDNGRIRVTYEYIPVPPQPVMSAVDEFVKEYDLELHTKRDDTDPDTISKRATDWWIVKE